MNEFRKGIINQLKQFASENKVSLEIMSDRSIKLDKNPNKDGDSYEYGRIVGKIVMVFDMFNITAEEWNE